MYNMEKKRQNETRAKIITMAAILNSFWCYKDFTSRTNKNK